MASIVAKHFGSEYESARGDKEESPEDRCDPRDGSVSLLSELEGRPSPLEPSVISQAPRTSTCPNVAADVFLENAPSNDHFGCTGVETIDKGMASQIIPNYEFDFPRQAVPSNAHQPSIRFRSPEPQAKNDSSPDPPPHTGVATVDKSQSSGDLIGDSMEEHSDEEADLPWETLTKRQKARRGSKMRQDQRGDLMEE